MPAEPEGAPAVAIFGATSDIAACVARRYAEAGWRLVLFGRNEDLLAARAADLQVRGAAGVHLHRADFTETGALPQVAAAAWEDVPRVDVALIAYGSLPDQAAAESDRESCEAALQLNFISPVLLANELARQFEAQGHGAIAVISSVAGDRGRASNFIYGAAKGGLQRYLEGLRHRLSRSGVEVLDIRPGFVSTKMTRALGGKGPLWATPDAVAADIVRAISKRRSVLYTPWFWRGIMTIVRSLPRSVLHRTKL